MSISVKEVNRVLGPRSRAHPLRAGPGARARAGAGPGRRPARLAPSADPFAWSSAPFFGPEEGSG